MDREDNDPRESDHQPGKDQSSDDDDNQENQMGSAGEKSTSQNNYTKILDRPTPRFATLEPISLSASDGQMLDSGTSYLNALTKLELETESITENLSQLLKYLQERTYEVTDTSAKCLDVLKSSLDDTCDVVDESIKTMYRLIAKCDEIMKSLEIVDKFREEVRSLKKVLDLFENTLKLKSSQYQMQMKISLRQ